MTTHKGLHKNLCNNRTQMNWATTHAILLQETQIVPDEFILLSKCRLNTSICDGIPKTTSVITAVYTKKKYSLLAD